MKLLSRFIHISDTHFAPPSYQTPHGIEHPSHGAERLIDALSVLPYAPDFILHTGDVAAEPVPAIYAEIQTSLNRLNVPIHYVKGNHDDPEALHALMKLPSARSQDHYARIIGEVKLVVLDSCGPLAGQKMPNGHVAPDQLDWLERELASSSETHPIVVAVHHPLLSLGYSEWHDRLMGTLNGHEVYQILRPYSNLIRVVLCGHVHQMTDVVQDGILYSAAPGSWIQYKTLPGQGMAAVRDSTGQPGYSLVTINDDSTVIQRFLVPG